MKTVTKKNKPFHLYWVMTPDHDEDWFILARNCRQAAVIHEDGEGYDRGDATAERVCQVPPDQDVSAGWPSNEVIEACGGKFIVSVADANDDLRHIVGSGKRIVQFGDRYFVEGDIVGNTLAAMGARDEN